MPTQGNCFQNPHSAHFYSPFPLSVSLHARVRLYVTTVKAVYLPRKIDCAREEREKPEMRFIGNNIINVHEQKARQTKLATTLLPYIMVQNRE